jgi:hypothetical protein
LDLETEFALATASHGYILGAHMNEHMLLHNRGCHTSSENGGWENGEQRMREKRSQSESFSMEKA